MLEIRGITRRFGSFTVFDDVSFTLEPGSACAVTGANGSGKSTLLRCIVGADTPDAGTVLFDGLELDETTPMTRSAIAAVVDEPGFFPHLSVREHLLLIASAHGVPDPARDAAAVIDEIGLARAADQLPVTLSSGQRHRLALASALVRPRRVLVLDEPEQHLDAAGREWLTDRLLADTRQGVAVLFVSHYAPIVDAVADQIVDGDSWR